MAPCEALPPFWHRIFLRRGRALYLERSPKECHPWFLRNFFSKSGRAIDDFWGMLVGCPKRMAGRRRAFYEIRFQVLLRALVPRRQKAFMTQGTLFRTGEFPRVSNGGPVGFWEEGEPVLPTGRRFAGSGRGVRMPWYRKILRAFPFFFVVTWKGKNSAIPHRTTRDHITHHIASKAKRTTQISVPTKQQKHIARFFDSKVNLWPNAAP